MAFILAVIALLSGRQTAQGQRGEAPEQWEYKIVQLRLDATVATVEEAELMLSKDYNSLGTAGWEYAGHVFSVPYEQPKVFGVSVLFKRPLRNGRR
jgi:hypothetical protein